MTTQTDTTNDSRHMTMEQCTKIAMLLGYEVQTLKEIEKQKEGCSYSTELTAQINVVNFLSRLLAVPENQWNTTNVR